MRKMHLKAHRETATDTALEDFVRPTVDVRGSPDRDSADTYKVRLPTVSWRRKRYQRKSVGSPLGLFEQRYGPDAVKKFQSIIEDPCSSLADVGRQFGFTRENARQTYEKIYGFSHTVTHKRKILLRRLKADSLRFSSGRLLHLRRVKEKIATEGLAPTILIEARSHLLVTNNNVRVAVVSASKLRRVKDKKYLQVTILSRQRRACDFLVLSYYNNGESMYYVIPGRVMPEKGTTIPVSSGDVKSKYSMYRDAWDLLRRG